MENKVDLWLQRISHISQVGLLITAIVVYVFTVIPVYKVGVLEEEIAHKTLELNTITAELGHAETKLAELTPKLVVLNKELEDSYNEIRFDSVNTFIFYAGAQCSGLFIPPAAFRDFSGKGPNLDVQTLSISPTECLQRELQKSKGIKRLRKQDFDLLSNEVRRIAAKLESEREAAARAYHDFPAKAAKDPALLKPLSPLMESFLSRPMSPQQREAERHQSQIREGQSSIVNAYSKLVRDEIDSLHSLKWK